MLLSARAAVAERWSPGLWTTSKCIPLYNVLTHVLPIFAGPIFAPVDLSVPLICVEATPWGLSVKYIAIDLCYSYICLLTQFNFRPFILVP